MNIDKEWKLSVRHIAGIIAGSVLFTAMGGFFLLGSSEHEEHKEHEEPFDWTANEEANDETNKIADSAGNETEEETIMVDVKGEVHRPGVYTLATDTRVLDAVEAAGGSTDEADEGQLNLAERNYDEMVVIVPASGDENDYESGFSGNESGGADDEQAGVIDLNQAEESDLTDLPGIGPAKAEAILSHREEQGRFNTAEELTDVPGIGEKTFDTLKELVTVR